MNFNQLLLKSIKASIEAGNAILDVYHSDKRSHEIIVNSLKEFDIPILSEEGKNIPYKERRNWDTLWIVDPLDGTKEFIKRNDEFTVNIALVKESKPVLGVIFIPIKETLYFASNEIGSYKVEKNRIIDIANRISEENENGLINRIIYLSDKLPISTSTNSPYTIVGSRSHATSELEAFVEEKRQEYGDVEFISAGSSLKFCLVAEGKADIYPRLGPTMEWGTAAGQAIAENADAKVLRHNTNEQIIYNKENLLNPWFVVLRTMQ